MITINQAFKKDIELCAKMLSQYGTITRDLRGETDRYTEVLYNNVLWSIEMDCGNIVSVSNNITSIKN